MRDSYYTAMDSERDQARQVGWRHRIEQAYRFETALEVVQAGDVVLDIGCGLGAFGRYVSARGLDVEVVGLERSPHFIAEGTQSPVIAGDYRDPELVLPRFDSAVAIGALIGPAEPAKSLADLLRVCQLANRAFCVLAIDARRVTSRPLIAADPALGGILEEDVRAALGPEWGVHIDNATSVEMACIASRSPRTEPLSNAQRFRATCEGPWGAEPPSRRAWLALEVGLPEEAAVELGRAGALDELGSIVDERLRLCGA